ncbi:MAG: serine hydrolase domain-containing protein [Propionibacteriaceae bacterium]
MRRLTTALAGVLLLLGLATSAAPSSAEPHGDLDSGQVDAFVEHYLDRHGLPGATVAVVKDGRTVHEAGYGKDSNGESLTEHSRMRAESVSKSFTAFAVLQLVDAGKVELDHPVQEYLPQFTPVDPRADDITVRQLLSHTSGLPSPIIVPPASNLEDGVARILDLDLTSDPGSKYLYSNLNYWTAGLIVQEVSGEDFIEYVHKNVFEPLEMSDSLAVMTSTEPVEGLPLGHVTAYGGTIPMRELEALMAGTGQVITSAHDMANWLSMQSQEGIAPDGEQLLSPELLAESHTIQPNAGRSGFGWLRSSPGTEPERIQHSGAGTSYQAQQTIVPSGEYAVVVLLNSFTPTREHAYSLADGVITSIEGGQPEVGAPVPTINDLALGAVTLAVIALGVRGLRRSSLWVSRRSKRGSAFFAVRQLPQLIMPALAIVLFVVTPSLQGNSSTPVDVFALYPAATVLVLVSAVVCLAQLVARTTLRARSSRS